MHFKISIPAFLLLLVVAFGCSDKRVQIYNANIPVYQSLTEWRATTFAMQAPEALHRPGKIYVYQNMLLVNEFMKGVHFFDNSNPASPLNLGFLPIVANVDIAVRNQRLYVDSYYDLLVFDISDVRNPNLVGRAENVFDFKAYGHIPGYDDKYPMQRVNEDAGIVTGWTVGKVTEETGYGYWDKEGDIMIFDATSGGFAGGGGNAMVGQGKAGSTARFALYGDYLYTLEDAQLGVFDIAGDIRHLRDLTLRGRCETLFPAGDNLFIGTQTGMLIYRLTSPASPVFLSAYEHFTACDPVVVQGDKAFVTLASGRLCWGNVNSLLVVDLVNLSSPVLLHEFPMTNPRGLGLDGNTLFLCDGPDGLKVFDKTDLSAIDQNMLSHFSGILANDLIPYNDVLIMTSKEGIYQYDYSDLQNIFQLSVIPVLR